LQESLLVKGVAFKKTFSYAGFEMQPKTYKNPKIALLNIELELKAERDNAEIRLDNVAVRLLDNVAVSCQGKHAP
jgi:T-complex protein 1 subunit eta